MAMMVTASETLFCANILLKRQRSACLASAPQKLASPSDISVRLSAYTASTRSTSPALKASRYSVLARSMAYSSGMGETAVSCWLLAGGGNLSESHCSLLATGKAKGKNQKALPLDCARGDRFFCNRCASCLRHSIILISLLPALKRWAKLRRPPAADLSIGPWPEARWCRSKGSRAQAGSDGDVGAVAA